MISVGNLSVGGSGKTPVVDYIARLLVAAGERPAILSRGYGRRVRRDGVTVVSDAARVLTPLDEAGDEPLMLARGLMGVPVLVGADRYLSGRLAEREFGTTVHLLDDGFQHFALARDVDLLLLDERDLHDRVLPAGRLREPLAAARTADAVIRSPALDLSSLPLNPSTPSFTLTRSLGEPPAGSRDEPALAVAGIARPERFFENLRAAGWRVAATLAFRDHHHFRDADVDRIRARASAIGARLVLTTAKDAVRLEAVSLGLEVAPVPLIVNIEPADAFRDWLLERLRAARSTVADPPSTLPASPSTVPERPSTVPDIPSTLQDPPNTVLRRNPPPS